MAKQKDLFDQWKASGVLQERLDMMTDYMSRGLQQNHIALTLGITPQYLSELKGKHPEIFLAIEKGNMKVIEEVQGALFKAAKGYKETIEEQWIEDTHTNQKPKRKIHRTEVTHAPDVRACAMLLNQKGVEYNEQYHLTMLKAQLASDSKESECDDVETTIIVDDVK